MLKGIPPEISPELMHVLMSMGHGDELVLADGNFPADANAQRIVRADGHGVPAILAAVLKFFPIDMFSEDVACVMQPVDAETPTPPIWSDFSGLLSGAEGRNVALTPIERFAFYDRACQAYAIVATGETAVYANLILKKGVVTP
ncbi:MAG: fucose isomerase [Planctomycetaceae bacterium]|nr:fucose isomerase [Planctomycetaceae bacterium]